VAVTIAKWGQAPSDARNRQGYFRSMRRAIFSKPTRAQLKRDFWRPEERRLLVRKSWGIGWTVNFAFLFLRGRHR
jgi:hypothetical protein